METINFWVGSDVKTSVYSLLLQDPSGFFAQLDFDSKIAYFRAISSRAQELGKSELEVAEDVLRSAVNAYKSGRPLDECHVGFHLFCKKGSNGKPKHISIFESIASRLIIQGLLAATLSAAVCFLLVSVFQLHLSAALLVALLIILLDSLRGLSQTLLARFRGHAPSFSLDVLSNGLPAACGVVIAVPIQLISENQLRNCVDTLVENVRRANDREVLAVLLTDHLDSSHAATTDQEQELLRFALELVRQANHALGKRYGNPIHLLHRERLYVSSERCWMGFDRKRGKLELLNKVILGANKVFSVQSDGAEAAIKGRKYVLVLDEDTGLPRHTLQRLVGFLEHPINAPVVQSGQLLRGHAIAIPASFTDTESKRTWRLASLVVGPSRSANLKAVKTGNFHYDWYHRCHYAGKGLYHVKAYDELCSASVPSGAILSHDTIEANALSPGFVDGAVLIDSFPQSLKSLFSRQERWIRGDVQNAFYVARLLRYEGKRVVAVRVGAFLYGTIFSQLLAWVSNGVVFITLAACVVMNAEPKYYYAIYLAMCCGGYQRLIMNLMRDIRHSGCSALLMLKEYSIYMLRVHGAQLLRTALSSANFFLLVRASMQAIIRSLTGYRLLQWRSVSLVEDQRAGVLWGRSDSYVFATACASLSSLALALLSPKLSLIGLLLVFLWLLSPFMSGLFHKMK